MDLRKTGLLTAAAAFAMVALAACRPAPSATIVIDPSLAPLIPADTTILTCVRIDKLKETELYRKLKAEGKLKPLDDFAKQTGIDLEKKVFDIMVASNGKTGVALVRVQFVTEGTAGVEQPLGGPEARRFDHKGYTLYGDEKVAATYFNRSVIVAGPTESVRAVIDNRDGSKGQPPAALLERVKSIPSTNQAWAVSFAGIQSTLPAGLPGPLAGLKSMPIDIRSIVAGLDVSQAVKFSAEVASGDEKSAEKMHDAVKGLIGIARLSTPSDKMEMLKFYDAIAVTRKAATVELKTDLPLDVLDMLINSLPAGLTPRTL
jgi:hypothetical protein